MTLPSRSAALAGLGLVLLSLGACATSSDSGRNGSGGSGFTVGAARWMSPTSEAGDPDASVAGTPAASRNYALERHDPWLGGIGFRQSIAESAELGLGLAVPKSLGGDPRSAGSDDRARANAGVGLWLTFDF